MKEILLTTLRDKTTSRTDFQVAAGKLSLLLAYQIADLIPIQDKLVTTPFGTTQGYYFANNVVVIVILRSGVAMLESFLSVFQGARIGFLGLKRDERTAKPYRYYENLPPIAVDDYVIIVDPMIATGGTGCAALHLLRQRDISMEQVIFVNILCSTSGRTKIAQDYPKITIISAHEDPALNDDFFIVPGFGDFGDRYCGTE